MFLSQVRRKKSTLSEVKLAVIGAPGVGKSGLLIIFYFMLNYLEFLDFVHIYGVPWGLKKQRCAAFNGLFLALTVRFLTKRYIGEYDHQSETR